MILIRFRFPEGNFYQVVSDVSFPGNMTPTQLLSILGPLLTNLPPQFNVTYFDTGSLIDDLQQLNGENSGDFFVFLKYFLSLF